MKVRECMKDYINEMLKINWTYDFFPQIIIDYFCLFINIIVILLDLSSTPSLWRQKITLII